LDATLGPIASPPGAVVAPGHHFEWSWLLEWARRLGVGEARSEADTLYAHGLRFGLDPHGFAVDECDRHGRQVRRSRRAWPQTELIKAYLTAARRGDAAAAEAAGRITLAFLDSYLATDVRGLWMDQFNDRGEGVADAAPASTLYHVMVAFRELILFAGSN
jgi:mannose-6-phosphate isomerase